MSNSSDSNSDIDNHIHHKQQQHHQSHNFLYDSDHICEECEQPKTHQISNDIAVHAVPVSDPISIHTKDLLYFRLRLSPNEITSASGALAGFLSGLVVCPLDVAKTRFQAQGAYLRSNNNNNNANNILIKPKYNGAIQSMNLIWKEEGIKGLYRGIVPITLGYFPTWMIYFSCYEHFKKFYSNLIHDENLSYFASAISSGAISSTITNPIWVVKTRLMLQMDNGKTVYDIFTKNGNGNGKNNLNNLKDSKRDWYNGTFDAFKKMYKSEGIAVFYKGLLPSYFGLCHVAIQFPLYENFKKLLKIDNNGDESKDMATSTTKQKAINFFKFILASSLSKMIASGITYPHELVRTRLQLFSNNNQIQHESQLSGLIRIIKAVIKTEGFLGFYSGFAINLARTVPASAVTMVSFEYFREYFQRFSY
jgi:solute carrier family 25 folate transporter 32